MNGSLIERVIVTNRVIFVLGLLLSIYLFTSIPATRVVSDRSAELASIDGMTNVTQLKAHASGLAMVAKNASDVSTVLFGVVIAMLLFFAALSLINLWWLRRLKCLQS